MVSAFLYLPGNYLGQSHCLPLGYCYVYLSDCPAVKRFPINQSHIQSFKKRLSYYYAAIAVEEMDLPEAVQWLPFLKSTVKLCFLRQKSSLSLIRSLTGFPLKHHQQYLLSALLIYSCEKCSEQKK